MWRRNCVPSPAPVMGSFDQAGNIGDYEAHFILGIAYGDDSKVRLEGGEG